MYKSILFSILGCASLTTMATQLPTDSPQTEAKHCCGNCSGKDLAAYLMVFFTDETHDLFMATSPDGYTFTAVNNGKPVIAGDSIAEQKGIRDPHITRKKFFYRF